MSGPKRDGSWVRVRTQGGLGDGFVSKPKGVGSLVAGPKGFRV